MDTFLQKIELQEDTVDILVVAIGNRPIEDAVDILVVAIGNRPIVFGPLLSTGLSIGLSIGDCPHAPHDADCRCRCSAVREIVLAWPLPYAWNKLNWMFQFSFYEDNQDKGNN